MSANTNSSSSTFHNHRRFAITVILSLITTMALAAIFWRDLRGGISPPGESGGTIGVLVATGDDPRLPVRRQSNTLNGPNYRGQPRQVGVTNDSSPRRFGRKLEGKRYLLVYNNVPKCGGRSLRSSMRELFKNRRKLNDVTMPVDKKHVKQTRQALEAADAPALVSGHMPFIHLERDDAVYINVIRDPIDRFTSHFYFSRNGDASGVMPLQHRNQKSDKLETIDEYVARGGEVREIMPYHFIEDNERNRNLSDEEKVNLCKSNIKRYFTFVGLTEHLVMTSYVLEKLLPEYFRGFWMINKKRSKEKRDQYSTVKKVAPSNKTRLILREKLRNEYELYYFVKRNFHRLHAKFKLLEKRALLHDSSSQKH